MVDAEELVRRREPDAVICEYDLLAFSLPRWKDEAVLSRVPLIAVSLTRHPGEAHLLDISGLAGFLYLPALNDDDALRLLATVQQKRGGMIPHSMVPWPGTKPVAQLR
jgi:hypothetical protein